MPQVKTFKEIKAWEKAHTLVLEVYQLTKKYPKDEVFGLVSQSRRAAVSVPANIAEGYKRYGVQDSARFYNISAASLEELKYHLLLAKDLMYISENEYRNVDALSDETGKVLHGWIKSQN